MTLEDKVHACRLHLLRRAQELGNVSAACRELGVSRSLYYQLRQRFTRYGSDGLPARSGGRALTRRTGGHHLARPDARGGAG